MLQKISRIAGLAAIALMMVTGVIGLNVVPAVADGQSVRILATAPGTVMPGDTFTVTINITQVQSLDATNYDVSFNPAVLQLVETNNVTAGSIGGSQVPVDMANVDGPGKVRIVQNVPGVRGISGAGYLAQLHFRMVGSSGQSSNIDLTNGMLSDSLATEIPSNWAGTSIRVSSSGGQEPLTTPPPVIQNPPPPTVPPVVVTPDNLSPVPVTQTPTSPVSPPATLETQPVVPVPVPVPKPSPSPVPVPGQAPAPPLPAQAEGLGPLLLWGIIGVVAGVLVVAGFTILQMRRRSIKIAGTKK